MKTYTKAVSATLASALAVGMVPAMALADEAAPEVVADDELELLVMTPAEAFAAGEVTAVKEAIADLDDIEFEYTGKAVSVTPTKVKPGTGAEITLDTTFDIQYYKANYDDKGEFVGTTGDEIDAPSAVGQYCVKVVAPADPYESAAVYLPFNIVAESLDGLEIFEPNAKAADGGLSDEEFVYNGKTFKGSLGTLGYKLNGVVFDRTDITGKVYKKNANGLWDYLNNTWPQDAGEYVIVATGKAGTEYAGSKVEIPMTVEKANLADLNLSLDNLEDTNPGTPDIADIKGLDKDLVKDLGDKAELTLKGYVGDEELTNGKGTYTYTLSLTDEYDEGNLTGTKDITFYVADTQLTAANLFYGDDEATELVANGGSILVDHSENDKDVDLSKFTFCEGTAYDKDEKVATKAVAVDAVTMKPVSDITAPGSYIVTVNVDAAAADYDYYSTNAFAFELTVIDGTVDAKNIAVLYNDKVVSTVNHPYDGTNVLDALEVIAKTDDGEKVLTAGKEYNYKIVDNDTGKEVSSIVNVNEDGYTLTISNGSYTIDGESTKVVNINVVAIDPLEIRVAGQVTVVTDATTDPVTTSTGLPYTGSEIVPSFEYYTAVDLLIAEKAAEAAAKEDLDPSDDEDLEVIKSFLTWTELPADVYTAELTTEVSNYIDKANGKVDLVGAYAMTLTMVEKNLNYDLTDVNVVPFQVINASVFKDVPAGKWYTEPVMNAYTQGYMNGIGNGLFQPMGTVTRGMAACILFNMAGGADDELGGIINNNEITNGLVGFVTPFEDVDAYKWYAQAIQWAEKAGVVNGYGDGSTFGPDDEITREQWAAMLANYAKVYGTYKAPAADALAGFADAGKVSGWAKESVAWAVENGIMGNGGAINAKAEITRAEAAAMAVNFQPVAL